MSLLRSKSIGFVFQHFNLLPKLTAVENVMVPLLYQGCTEKEAYNRSKEALKQVGLSHRINHLPNELSGGQMQRVPITTIKYLNTDTKVNSILLKVEDTSNINKSILNVENNVRSEFQISTDYFTVTSSSSILESMDNITNTLTLLLGGIASISLIVGGIGVMNVMLVSVSERTKEIGIRKSLGAKRKDIMNQFLIESLMLCITGGILGIIFSVLIGYIISIFNISFTLSTTIIILSVTISLFIGLIFGIFPAYKASSLNPIDALRSE